MESPPAQRTDPKISLGAYYKQVWNQAVEDTQAEVQRIAFFQAVGCTALGGLATIVLAGELNMDAGLGGLIGFGLFLVWLFGQRLLRAPARMARTQDLLIEQLQSHSSEFQTKLAEAESKLTQKADNSQKCDVLWLMHAEGELILTRMKRLDHNSDPRSDPFGIRLVAQYSNWQEGVAAALKTHFDHNDYSLFHVEVGLDKPPLIGGATPRSIEIAAELLTYRLIQLSEIIKKYCE